MLSNGPKTWKKALFGTAAISKKLYETAMASRVKSNPEYAKLPGSVIWFGCKAKIALILTLNIPKLDAAHM